MTKLRFFIFASLTVFIPNFVHAALQDNGTCVVDTKDDFEPRLSFTKGAFKGECADARTVRPVRILSEDKERFVVANFYDEGQFWRASVPKGMVDRVYFQIVPFDSGFPFIQAAHTQFRFLLKEGAKIDLEPQSPGAAGKMPTPRQTSDVIISSTFVAPHNVEYSAWRSRGGSYGIATRLMTSYARGREEIQKDKSMVRQFEIKLTPEEKNALFVHAIQRASTEAYGKTYGLLKYNCTTLAFDILDDVRPRPTGVEPMRGNIWNMRDEFIEPSIRALRERGLIDDNSEIQPMNAEMKFD